MTVRVNDPAARRFARFASRVAWLGFALAVFVLLGAGLLIVSERRTEIDTWRTRVASLSSLLSLTVGQVVSSLDGVVADLISDIALLSLDDENEFARAISAPQMRNTLLHRFSGLPQVLALAVVDASGRLLVSVGDAALYEQKRTAQFLTEVGASPERRLVIGRPVAGAGDVSVFPAGRAITLPGGRVIGMVIALVDANFFERYVERGEVEEAVQVGIVRQDGAMIALAPSAPGPMADMPDALFLREKARARAGLWMAATPSGSNGFASAGMISAMDVHGSNLVVAVFVKEAHVLSRWRNWSSLSAAAALAISTLLVLFTLFVSRVLVWQDRMLAEVAAARDAAEQASRAKTNFLSLVSHEFRTPLNALIGSAELIGLERATRDRADYAKIISVAAKQLLNLIDNVLGLTRLEHQKFEHKSAPFAFRDLMSNAMIIGRTLVGSKPIDLTSSIDDNIPDRLVGDAGALSQIVLNLVSNAVKYTQEGHVSVHAALASTAPLRVSIIVSDTGMGIPADMLGRLFKPFERGNSERVRVEAGTGLGLAITERLVGGMGGSIVAANNRDGGATFTVEVPFALGEDEASDSAPAEADHAKERLSILLAEDSGANRLVLKAMLESLGHEVTTAVDGQDAVTIANGRPFDLIIMDVQMPVMDGYEATRQIRAMPEHRDTPMVALTAFTEQEHRDRAREVGMDRLIPKPARLPDLAAVTRTIRPTLRKAS